MAKSDALFFVFASLMLIDAVCGRNKFLGDIATDKRNSAGSMSFGNPGGNDGASKKCSIEVKEVRNGRK